MYTPKTLINDDSGILQLYPDWLKNSGQFFELIKEQSEFKGRNIKLFGKEVPIPRLESFEAEEGVQYTYSGQTYVGRGLNSIPEMIMRLLPHQFNWKANSVLINYYRNGADSMGWHSDDEPELGNNPSVAIVSFGSPRRLKFRDKKQKDSKHSILLEPGGLLWMSGAIQHNWQHGLGKVSSSGERISCTFRQIVE